MSRFRKITANTLYQAGGKRLSLVFGLIITGIFTRYLGQEGYGQYVLITTIIIFLGTITDWGTGFIAARAAARKEFPPEIIYGNVVILRIVTSIAGAIGLNILAWTGLVAIPLPLMLVGSLVVFALAIRNSMLVIFQVHLKLQYGAIVEALTNTVFLILVYLVLNQSSITPILVITALFIASTISGLAAMLFGLRLSPIVYKVRRDILAYLIKESLPMGTLLVTFSIYNRLDTFVLQHFQGDQAVGLYGFAYKLHDNAAMGAAFFMNAVYPLIAQSGTGSPTTRRIFSTAFHLLIIVGILSAGTIFIFAPQLVWLLADESFLPAVIIIRILMFATLISYINHLTGYTLAALGLQRISLIIAVVGLILNISLNFLLVPIYSYTASAYLTILTEGWVMVCSLSYLIIKQKMTPEIKHIPRTLYRVVFNRRQLF